MYSRKALYQYSLYAEVEGRERRVLSRRALTVVRAADDYRLAHVLRSSGELFVAYGEAVLRDLRYIRAQGQYLSTRGHDVVGGDVVADFQRYRALYALVKRRGLGERLYVRTSEYLYAVHFLCGCGRYYHVVVDNEVLRQLELGHIAEVVARVGEVARQRRYSRHFGRYEVDLSVLSAGTSLKVSVECSQRNAARVRRLTHAYAGAAGGFEYSCARVYHV